MSLLHVAEDKEYRVAKVLTDNISPEFLLYFEKEVYDKPFSNFIYDSMKVWFFEKSRFGIQPDVTLLNFIYYAVGNITKEFGEDTQAALRKYAEVKRQKKKYLYSSITDEYNGTPKNSNLMSMTKQVDSYFILAEKDASIQPYTSKKEYIDILYNEITDWKKKKDSLLIQFKYFSELSERRRFDCLLCDLTYHILSLITHKFFGKFDGGLTSIPPELLQGVFSFKKAALNIELSQEENRIYAKDRYTFTEEDGSSTQLETILKEYDLDKSIVEMEEADKQALIEQMKSEISFGNALDSDELNALAVIYSSINAQVVAESRIHVNGRLLCCQILGKNNIRERDSKSVLASIDKLANYRLRRIVQDQQGNVKGKSVFNFFEYNLIDEREDNTNDNQVVHAEIGENPSSEFASKTLPDEILAGDKWSIDIYPSVWLKETWKQHKNTEIYTKLYNQIGSSKTKTFMMFLQNGRMENFPQSKILFSWPNIKNHFRMHNLKLSALKKELLSQLKTLMSEGIMVKEYAFTSSGMEIEFLPFTDIEKMLYQINNLNMIE